MEQLNKVHAVAALRAAAAFISLSGTSPNEDRAAGITRLALGVETAGSESELRFAAHEAVLLLHYLEQQNPIWSVEGVLFSAAKVLVQQVELQLPRDEVW